MKQDQQGSGSAENTERDRQEQVNHSSSPANKQQVSKETGISQRDIGSIDELGQRSGRDDYSGGSGEGMEGQSTGQPTDR
jgi:hypothetical protein